MKTIDLNVDVGEGVPFDVELLDLATSANVCCGAHAGDDNLTRVTVHECRATHTAIGAHPGVPDRASMGRAPLPEDFDRAALLLSVLGQVDFLVGLGAVYVKPHGELYNASARREDVADLMTDVLRACGLPLLGLPGTLHEDIARSAGVPFFSEGFADRAYTSDGHLVLRSQPGSLLCEPSLAAAQALDLAERVDSLCVHGDTPGAYELLRAVKTALETDEYRVASCV